MLVAEDNMVDVAVVTELLHRLGLEVDHAADGASAARLTCSSRYALVLMGVQMPIMDGLEATWTIRSHRPSSLPIVMVEHPMVDPAELAEQFGIGFVGAMMEPLSS